MPNNDGAPPPRTAAPGATTAPDEPPPILGTWPRVYIAIVCYLAGFIALLAFFTWGFHR